MQRSYTSLHLHSPIFFLAAERKNLRRSAASSLRATSASCHVVGLRGNTPPQEFFSQSPPTQKKLALRGNKSNASPCGERPWLLLPQTPLCAHLTSPLSSCSHRVRRHHSMFGVDRGACHCRSSCSAVALPMASHLLRQSHAFRAVLFAVVGAAPHGITLAIGPFAVT
jgi:hypothetical protein